MNRAGVTRVPRDEWVRAKLEAAAREPQQPGLRERLEELASAHLGQLGEEVAQDLADGCPDTLLGEVRATWSEIDPDDVRDRAVTRLASLGIDGLTDRAADAIRRHYRRLAADAHPAAGRVIPREGAGQIGEELQAVKEAVGWQALAAYPTDLPGEALARVGEVLLSVVHSDLLKEREEVLGLWQRGDWQALHDRNEIGIEELRKLLDDCQVRAAGA